EISAANSLVGSSNNDNVGEQIAILSNGNYVVISPQWNDGAKLDVGAVTLGDGTVGVQGTISAANSLIGSHDSDRVGSGRVTALSNGNYVIASPLWDDEGTADVGAVTFGDGTSGVVGEISAGNSLIGATAGDQIGSGVALGSVFALTNGNYV